MRPHLADGLGRTQVGASLETTEDRKESPRIDGDFMIDFISFSSFFVDLHLFCNFPRTFGSFAEYIVYHRARTCHLLSCGSTRNVK